MAKKFFYVCAGIFLLALSYHFGASTAHAQYGASIVGATIQDGRLIVITSSGDVYSRYCSANSMNGGFEFVGVPMSVLGNYWGGQPPLTNPRSAK